MKQDIRDRGPYRKYASVSGKYRQGIRPGTHFLLQYHLLPLRWCHSYRWFLREYLKSLYRCQKDGFPYKPQMNAFLWSFDANRNQTSRT